MKENKENKTNEDYAVAVLEQQDGFTTQMTLGNHKIIADEPEHFGGQDLGPNPYELLSGALASCTAITIQMYARRKEWELYNVEVHVKYKKDHCIDCKNVKDKTSKIDIFQREIYVIGNLDDKQRNRLLQIADKCPVHKTLHSEVEVITKLRD